MSGGAQFAEVEPKRLDNGQLDLRFQSLGTTSLGLINGDIQPLTPLNSFRIGQQVVFWLGVHNPDVNGVWATRLRLKLWWARPNLEYRTPGVPTYEPIDTETFGPGPLGNEGNNRYVWMPSPKRLDVTPFQAPPPAASVFGTSDSLLLDDVLTLDLQDATDPAYIANFPAPQVPSRWVVFLYPAMGYALGVTWEADMNDPQGAISPPNVSLTWKTGALAGSYQESVG